MQHLQQAGYGFVQIQNNRTDGLFSGKGQELACQISRSPGNFQNFRKITVQRMRGIDLIYGYFGIASDGLKHVVEIMGHPAGQSSHGLHLLRLVQLYLQFFPFRFSMFSLSDVSDAFDGTHNVAKLIVQGRNLCKNPCALIVIKSITEHFRRKAITFAGYFGIPGRNIPPVHEN